MRYLFRGMIRTNGRIVEGHVDAPDAGGGVRGVIGQRDRHRVATPRPPPRGRPRSRAGRNRPEPTFRQAIDSALDSASMQVAFDSLTEQYKGQKGLGPRSRQDPQAGCAGRRPGARRGSSKAETDQKTRELVQEAIKGMFADNRNIASEPHCRKHRGRAGGNGRRRVERAARRRPTGWRAAAKHHRRSRRRGRHVPFPRRRVSRSRQATRWRCRSQKLSGVVLQAERALASIISAAARRRPRRRGRRRARGTVSGPVGDEAERRAPGDFQDQPRPAARRRGRSARRQHRRRRCRRRRRRRSVRRRSRPGLAPGRAVPRNRRRASRRRRRALETGRARVPGRAGTYGTASICCRPKCWALFVLSRQRRGRFSNRYANERPPTRRRVVRLRNPTERTRDPAT